MKTTFISVAVVAAIHGLVSVITAIDSGMWEWYASFLFSAGVTVFTVSRASELADAETRKVASKLVDAYPKSYRY
jgi:uncharacterized protein (DUF2252 family)